MRTRRVWGEVTYGYEGEVWGHCNDVGVDRGGGEGSKSGGIFVVVVVVGESMMMEFVPTTATGIYMYPSVQ